KPRHLDPERLRALEFNHQLEPAWPVEWQFPRSCAAENSSDIARTLLEHSREGRAVSHESAHSRKGTENADRRQASAKGKLGNLRALIEYQWRREDDQAMNLCPPPTLDRIFYLLNSPDGQRLEAHTRSERSRFGGLELNCAYGGIPENSFSALGRASLRLALGAR